VRISRMEKIDPHTVLGNRRDASAGEHVAFALAHPVSYAKTVVGDLINLMLNPGTNTLLGRYLKLYEMPEESDFFTRVRDQGLTAFTVTILTYSPLLALTNVLSLLLVTMLLTGGAVRLYRSCARMTRIGSVQFFWMEHTTRRTEHPPGRVFLSGCDNR